MLSLLKTGASCAQGEAFPHPQASLLPILGLHHILGWSLFCSLGLYLVPTLGLFLPTLALVKPKLSILLSNLGLSLPNHGLSFQSVQPKASSVQTGDSSAQSVAFS